MTVQELIDMATYGEVSNLSVKDNNNALVSYINLGLIELYKRFPLDSKEIVIALSTGVDIYDMPDDTMWLVAAYGEVDAKSDELVNVLPINEEDNPLSVNAVNWNQVQIPNSLDGSYVSIIYVASPVLVNVENLSSSLPIPAQLIESLLHYVGYRAHGAMNGELQSESTSHYQRFEASCKRIEGNGMFTSDDLSMRKRIIDRGFV